MTVGHVSFEPSGKPGAPPDSNRLMNAAGGMVWPSLRDTALFSGEPLISPNTLTLLAPFGGRDGTGKGVLMLTRIPLATPVIDAIGLDPFSNVAGSIGNNRFGIYAGVDGVPKHLIADCGLLTHRSTKMMLNVNFVGDPAVSYWAGWVWQGGRGSGPRGWGDTGYTALLLPAMSTRWDVDNPDLAAGFPEWSESDALDLSGAPPFWYQTWSTAGLASNIAGNPGGFGSGYVYYPRNKPDDYGVNHTLPDTLPDFQGVAYNADDGVYYGFARDAPTNATALRVALHTAPA